MNSRERVSVIILLLGLLLLIVGCQNRQSEAVPANPRLQVERDLVYQVECGPRFPGSKCHGEIRRWILENLDKNHWNTETQTFVHTTDITGVNIIGKYGSGTELILFGTHYDTRFTADREPQIELRSQPVPGANDGASGVALLLHLAREIPKLPLSDKEIWLVFFDLEDNGDYPGWDWILGSTAFVDSLSETPQAVVIVDMVGDRDLNLFYEYSSTMELSQQIWHTARQLGYEQYFRPQLKYHLIDDHLPFIRRGIPATLLIDFDYPYWHTTLDTLDKVSSESVLVVSHTLLHWLSE